MRILRIINSHDKGGVFTCEMQFIKELKNKDAVVDVAVLGNGDKLRDYKQASNTTYRVPLLKARYRGPIITLIYNMFKTYYFGFKYAKQLKKQIGDQKYDAVIYQKAIYIHLAGHLANLLKAKCYWHMPNVARTTFSKNYYNYFLQKYGIHAVANSIYTKNTLGNKCKYVVYPGYDSIRVIKSEPVYRYNLKLGADAPVYGIAARMQADKAQDIVVEAFVKSNIPAAGGHLLIAGGPLDSDFAQKVQQQAGKLLNKQIHFLGEVEDMPAFYSSVDVVINGRRNVEPFGISIAEAMGAGKPVIAYKLGGPAEMIKHTVNGWLVENPTVGAYKEVFDQSIANRHHWPDMGREAKEKSKNFTIEENVDTLMNIIVENN